jgi:hypothetical protein
MTPNEAPIHSECKSHKVRVNVELYISAPTEEEADLFAMKYVRRALSLNFQQGFSIDVPVHVGTGLIKQGRVSVYHPRVM